MRPVVRTAAVGPRSLIAVCLLMLLLVAACNQPPGKTSIPATPTITSTTAGCAGTVLTNNEPPLWAQAGWSVTKGSPWPVPWAAADSGQAVAFVFAGRLVAGASPRVDGSSNKVLWELRDPVQFVVEGRPAGKSAPVVTVPGGPSIVDVPTPGCWTFRLIPSNHPDDVSTISLDVLPHGTKPN
jgi:hypothetical protein